MGKSLDRAARVKDRLLGRSKRTGPAQAQEPEETQKPEQAEASGQAQEPARAEDPELSDSEKTPQQLCIEAFETFVAGLRNPPYSKITQKITPVFEHTERKVQLLARVDEPRTSFSSGLKDHMSSDAHKAVRYAFCGRGLLRKKILDVVVNNLGFENLITGDVIWALHWWTDNTSSKYNPDTVFGKTPKICDEAVEGCIAATEKERDKILAELNGSDVVAGPASE